MSTNCHCIVKVPEQLNITYGQQEIERRHEVYRRREVYYSTIGQELLTKGTDTAKTIVVYCHSYLDIIAVFQEFVVELRDFLRIKDKDGHVLEWLVEKSTMHVPNPQCDVRVSVTLLFQIAS